VAVSSTFGRRLVGALSLALVAAGGVQAQTRDLLLPTGTDTAWHGAWLPFSRAITSSQITTFEGQADRKLGALLIYLGWYAGAWDDVQRQLNVVDPMGIKVMVTWEPKLKNGGDPLAAILNGSQDAIIDDFARKSKAWGKPFFLRFGHEMNGNWYSWSGAQTGNDPQKYVAAWQHVWARFQAAGNTNAVWVWSPNADSVPDEPWNDRINYYPGDSYVDWVGIDFYGLKWGDQPPGPAIDKVYVYYASVKPIMVAETAAADCANYAPGATMTKAEWTASLFSEMAANVRPNVRAFFWFNENKRGEADWRITSCNAPGAQDAYRAGVASSKYVTRP
jgi:hypothetical protein